MAQSNPYFPCTLVEQEDDYSVICSNFDYFDDYFGDRGGGGYTVERLAKKLVRENAIQGVKFDSEADMFCAYSDRKGPLKALCTKLRKITGGEAKHRTHQEDRQPTISLDKAEQLLLKGFVLSLDKRAQNQFLKKVPEPALTKVQSKLLQTLRKGSDAEKVKAARKINSEARTRARNWDHYLSHPATTQFLIEAAEANRDSHAVYQEIIWALVFIGDRHLPDLRTKPHFIEALGNSRQQMRSLGLMGLQSIGCLTPELIKPLLKDKSSNVRETAEEYLEWVKEEPVRSFPSWMFEPENVEKCRG